MMTSPGTDDERAESAADIREDEEGVGRPEALFYPHVGEFVTDRLRYFYSSPVPGSGLIWCPRWFEHAQALSRLDSIWRAWENLRFEPALGMSNWWTHYADPNMRALMDPVTGPFAHCGNGHQNHVPLPVHEPPAGLFSDQRANRSMSNYPLAID